MKNFFLSGVFFLLYIYLSANTLPNYKIIETKTGNEITLNELVQKCLKSQIIFFGEFHDNSLHHHLETAFLQELHKNYPKTAVSLEMFERDVQPVLNDYLNDRINETEFINQSRPWGNYSTDYKPLVEYAKQNLLPVIAANIPRRYASLVNKKGMTALDSLSKSERAFIASRINNRDSEYRTLFYQVMKSNMGGADSVHVSAQQRMMFESLYIAQCLKDDTMAESILNFIKKNKKFKVIHYNGDFHSAYHLGTAERIPKKYKKYVISPVMIKPGQGLKASKEDLKKGDFLIIHYENEPQKETEMPPQTMFKKTKNSIYKHSINLELNLDQHSLMASDELIFKKTLTETDTLYLNNDLKISQISFSGKKYDYSVMEKDGFNAVVVKTNQDTIPSIKIEYMGIIYHPADERELKQTHSYSKGMISVLKGEGVFLPGDTWYPVMDNNQSIFNVTAVCDTSLSLITSGMETLKIENGKKVYEWKSEIPLYSQMIVGNRFHQAEIVVNNTRLRVYLFDDAKENSTRYLLHLKDVYEKYTTMLGDYPFSVFSVVENFFPSGFGLPGFTVITSDVLKRPFIAESPGVLAHEFVHNWWGNSVFNDEKGNWSEALTTYCTNYYWHTLNNDAEKALKFRYQALKDLSLNESEYALSDFMAQNNEEDAIIGYQKGALFLIQIAQMISAESLNKCLKAFASRYRGEQVGWDELFAMVLNDSAFIQHPKYKEMLDFTFRDKNIPELRIDNFTYNKNKLEFKVTSNIPTVSGFSVKYKTSEGDLFDYYVIDHDSVLVIKKEITNLLSFEIDPEYYTLRKINKETIPYTFSMLFTQSPLLILPPEKDCSPSLLMFASMLQGSGMIGSYRHISEQDSVLEQNSIVIGNQKNNSLFKHFNSMEDKFMYDGDIYDVNQYNIMFADKDRKIGFIYIGNEPGSYRRLLRYSDYSLVFFDVKSEAVLTKTIERNQNPLKKMITTEEK